MAVTRCLRSQQPHPFSHGKSPFKVNYGYNTNILPGTKPQAPFCMPASTTFISQMQKIHAEAKQALKKAADQMKAQYDKKKRPAIEYQVGDKVWLDTTNLNLPRPKKKLADKQMGPFEISQRKELRHTCSNSLPIGTFIQHSTKQLLTPYMPSAFPNQEQPPPPPARSH